MIDISKYEQGTVLFAGPDDDKSVIEAKEFVEKNGINKDLVKLVRMTITLENQKKSKIIAVIVK